MEEILWFLAELLFEGVFDGIIEIIAEFFGHRFKRDAPPPGMFKSILAYTALGVMVGLLSLILFPNAFTPPGAMRVINLFFAPLIAAAFALLLARFRRKKGQSLIGLDNFGYAYLFAFSLSLVRFAWAH